MEITKITKATKITKENRITARQLPTGHAKNRQVFVFVVFVFFVNFVIHAEKLAPHPQLRLALGLLNTNPPLSSSSS